MLRIFLCMSIALSLIAIVSAESLQITIQPIKDSISPVEDAVFNISITNLLDQRNTVSVYSPTLDVWSTRIRPDSAILNPGETTYMTLTTRPRSTITTGRDYGIQLNFRSERDRTLQTAYAFISILSQEQINRQYTPIFSMNVSELGVITPNELAVLEVEIENKNVREYEALEFRLDSSVFSQRSQVQLEALEKKKLVFNLDVPAHTEPVKENLIVTVRIGNQTIVSGVSPYEVAAVERFDRQSTITREFLLRTHNVALTNEGNVPTEAVYNVPANMITQLFVTSQYPARSVKIDGKRYKQIYATLDPEERVQFVVKKSYRPILYVLIALILLTLFYYVFRSPIVVRKSVATLSTKEGSLSEMKVLVHIKNRTNKSFDDIKLLDRIPKITKIGKEFEIGTIKPIKIITHERKGTIAHWEINTLDSYEERVIAYKLYSNLNILGGLTLPVAMLKFRTKLGREKKVTSNKIKLVIQKEEQ